MDTQSLIIGVFSGAKQLTQNVLQAPILPFFAFVIIISFSIILLKKILTKSAKSKRKLFTNNNFKVVSLLNKEEIRVYEALLEHIQVATENNYRIFPQVSMGGILKNPDRGSLSRINQKRADFCIVDSKYMPIAIIEYNGGGHYKGNYKERDEVKQAATEYAGLIFHVIYEKDLSNLQNHIQDIVIPLLSNKDRPPKSTHEIDRNGRIEPKF